MSTAIAGVESYGKVGAAVVDQTVIAGVGNAAGRGSVPHRHPPVLPGEGVGAGRRRGGQAIDTYRASVLQASQRNVRLGDDGWRSATEG